MNDVFAPAGSIPQKVASPKPMTEGQGPTVQPRIRHVERDNTAGVIHLSILLRLSIKNLIYKKLRTFLTILGVVIGAGAVVFLFSFGVGLQNLVNRQVIGSRSVNLVDVSAGSSQALTLTPERIARLQAIPGVDSVGKIYNAATDARLSSSQFESVVYGTDSEYLSATNLEILSGRQLNADTTNQALVSSSVLRVAGIKDNQAVLGKQLKLNFEVTDTETGSKKMVAKDFTVTGVVNSEAGSEIYISNKVFESAGRYDADQVKAVVRSKDQVQQVRREIESIGFSTSSPLDTIEQINQVFALLRFVLVGFGGIGIIIAILGMFNTLTISLLERTREIALLISLGARRQDIKRMFIIESLLLSLIGAFIGIIGALLLGKTGDMILTFFARQRGVNEAVSAFTITPALFLVTLLASLLLGFIVVYFPARRASKVNPIDTLRYE